MDAVANMTLDLAKSDNALPPVLNVVHPRPSPWIDVFTNINDALGARLPFIPFEQWVTVLEEQAANPTAKTVERIVGKRILSYAYILADAEAHSLRSSCSNSSEAS